MDILLLRFPRHGVLAVLLVLTLEAMASAAEPVPSFDRDVMAVLSHSGCNLGTCHGNARGKGGLKLSLRGDDPRADYLALTRDQSGRRISPAQPDDSLLLLKPTMQVAHQGGQRFRPDSAEYDILRRWIAGGAPAEPANAPRVTDLQVEPREILLDGDQQRFTLRAIATHSDGTKRDVTGLVACDLSQPIANVLPGGVIDCEQFGETTITVRYLHLRVPVRVARIPARPGFVFQAPTTRGPIDEIVFAKLQRLRIQPAPLCDDTTFLRRLYVDLLGTLPTAHEARDFVASSDPHKRATLIDELLERPEFAEFWALKWSDLLRNEEKTLDRKGVNNLHHWIKTQIATDAPWNEMAAALVSGRGSTYSHPPANYYRALRDPIARSEATAQVFLGVRLQCAKCHNHPFDRWTQDDFYAWTNLFARIDYKIVDNDRRDDNDKHEFVGEQIVFSPNKGDVNDPRTGQPQPPRFLLAKEPLSPKADRLAALGQWLAAAENPFFARAQVNRVWFHLFGRGIVDPIDDVRESNPPSHPELLDHLAREFAASGFRLKPLVRMITNSATYQLAAETNETNASDELNFARSLPRRLSAEPLLDALAQTLGTPSKFRGYPDGLRAIELPGVQTVRNRDRSPTPSDKFLVLFGKPPRLQSAECERTDSPTLVQAFQLISGEALHGMLIEEGNQLGQLLESGTGTSEVIHEAYWSTLSRPPVPEEEAQARTLIQDREGGTLSRTGLEDLYWSLLTSHEFLLRR